MLGGAVDGIVLGPTGRGFRRYWLAVGISALGTSAAAVALALRMYASTHSPAWTGALFVAQFAPPVVVGLFLADLLDRLSPRRMLVGADLVRAAVFAALVVVHSPTAVIALAVVAGFANGVFRPVSLAHVPDLVDDHELEAANGAVEGFDNAATLVGYALGGVIYAAVGAGAALAANAASFAVSAMLVAGLTALVRAPRAAAADGFGARMASGLRPALAAAELRAVLLAWGVVAIGVGATNAIYVPFLRGTLGLSAAAVGVLFSCAGAGLVAGALLGGSLARRHAPGTYAAALALTGAPWLVLALEPPRATIGPLLFLTGLGNGIAIVFNQTFAQRVPPAADRVRVVAFLGASISLGVALGGLAGGFFGSASSPTRVLAAAGLGALALAVPLALLLLRAASQRAGAVARAPGG